MRDLQSIEFQFENCESFSIDAKYIGAFYIGDIRREISRIACNAICDMDIAHEFCAEIYGEGDGEYEQWGDKGNKFNRILSYDDITSVTLKYDNGTEEELYLDYKEANGEEDMLCADNGEKKIRDILRDVAFWISSIPFMLYLVLVLIFCRLCGVNLDDDF